MFRQLFGVLEKFHRQATRCTICLRPTEQEIIPPENLVQGHYVCPTCQQSLTPEEISTSLQALGLIRAPYLVRSDPLAPDVFTVLEYATFRYVLTLQFTRDTYYRSIHAPFKDSFYFVTIIDMNDLHRQTVATSHNFFTHTVLQSNENGYELQFSYPVTISLVSTASGLVLTDNVERLHTMLERGLTTPMAVYKFGGYILDVSELEVTEENNKYRTTVYVIGDEGSEEYNGYNFDKLFLLRNQNYQSSVEIGGNTVYTFGPLPTVLFIIYCALGWVLTDDLFYFGEYLRTMNLIY